MGISDWGDTPKGRWKRANQGLPSPSKFLAEQEAAGKAAANVRADMAETDAEMKRERAKLKAQEEEDSINIGNAQVNGYKRGGFVRHGKESKGKTKGKCR
jgi:hypothetical protein